MISKRASEFPGPYPLQWISDQYCPAVADMGPGLGCIKAKGHSPFNIALCPSVVLLAKESDPARRGWQPHPYSNSEPEIEAEPGLTLVSREWRPHEIRAEYDLGGARLEQTLAVFSYGAQSRIMGGWVGRPRLAGASYGECKVWAEGGGLHVVELALELKPFEYVIAFENPPEEIEVGGRRLGEDVWYFSDRVTWKFLWPEGVRDIGVRTTIHSSWSPHTDRTSYDPALGETSRQVWESFYSAGVPRLETEDARVDKLSDYLAYVYRFNAQKLGGLMPHPFTMPKEVFSGHWLWDTCYHAIGGGWHADRELAWGHLLNFEALQMSSHIQIGPDERERRAILGLPDLGNAPASRGVIPDQANPYGLSFSVGAGLTVEHRVGMPHLVDPDQEFFTQPPVVAQALEALWETDGNRTMLQRLMPMAEAYHGWFERCRASKRFPGLIVANGWRDSGMDNSKRWGDAGSGTLKTALNGSSWSPPLVALDLSHMHYLEKCSLARLFRALDRADDADRLEREAVAIAAAIHKVFWNPDQNFYCDVEESNGRHVPVQTPLGFYPLLLANLPAERLEILLGHLFDEQKFWCKAPLPSLAMDDPDFRADHSYWMGCSWFSYTYFILKGLFLHRPEAGWKLLDRVLDMLLPDGVPAIYENYNPLTGAGNDCFNFGWSGLLNDFFLREVLGLRVEDGRLVARPPSLPSGHTHFEIHHLPFRGRLYEVTGRKTGHQWSTEIQPAR